LDQPIPTGLKPTLRQMMIVVLWAALLIAALRALIYWQLLGNSPEMVCLSVPINVGVWPLPLLAILLLLLDRPGRVRGWYCTVCLAAGGFLCGILFMLADPVCYYLTGKTTIMFPMDPIFSFVFFLAGWMQWRPIRPRQCPNCARIAVIPIAVPMNPSSKRMVNLSKHGWCASCGASCEREGKGEWRLADLSP
jgi:hypothetical protein